MKRLLLILGVLALVLAACGGGDETVATVNGEDIARSSVTAFAPPTEGEMANAEFTQFLSVVIQWEAVVQAASTDFDIEPTEDEIAARVTELVAAQAPGASLEDYLVSVGATEIAINAYAEQLLIQEAVEVQMTDTAEPVTEEAVTEALVDPLAWTVVCSSHILVETEEDATVVVDRLDAGEEFATIAQETSIDQSSAVNGGDLGCTSPAQFVEPFAAATMEAELGIRTDPVESEFGYHIILVSQREEATPEIVREALETQQITSNVDAWFVSVLDGVQVEVAEDVGVWVTDPSPQVLATN
ncbi:MAG: peptidylprolyl isomerase [Actinomycetota bacterium]